MSTTDIGLAQALDHVADFFTSMNIVDNKVVAILRLSAERLRILHDAERNRLSNVSLDALGKMLEDRASYEETVGMATVGTIGLMYDVAKLLRNA